MGYAESNRGTIAVHLKKGFNKISIQYVRPVSVTIGLVISVLSFLFVIFWGLFKRRT